MNGYRVRRLEVSQRKMRIKILIIFFFFHLFSVLPGIIFAEDIPSIQLPAPRVEGGRPLMQVLQDRKSTRQFSPRELSPQILSDLLWAAWGINRPQSGLRTAPSTKNWQEIDVYVVTEEGVYFYNAHLHILDPVISGDIRRLTGLQDFVHTAPVNLVYAADFSKIKTEQIDDGTEKEKEAFAGVDAAFISQNVYLYCASEGLATVVWGAVNKEALGKAMRLNPNQKVVLAQTVGYEK